MIRTRTVTAVARVLLCAAVVTTMSSCAFVARSLLAVETVSTVHDYVETLPDDDGPTRTRPSEATVDGTGGSGLRLRGAPGADVLLVLPEGSVVTPVCRTDGPAVAGPWRETTGWISVRSADGMTGYVSDAYLDVTGPAVPTC